MACDLAFKRIAPSRSGKPPAHWWNADIASKRRACVAAKRAKTRCVAKYHLRLIRGRDLTTVEEAVAAANTRYKEARKCLKTAIAGSKERCWKEMLETIDADPWGKPYKLVTRKLQGPPATTNMDANAVLRITDTLFPIRPPADAQILPVEVEFPPFSVEEVNKVVHRAQQKSTAPGLDCITGRILSVIHRLGPTMLTGLYNQCARDGIVPASWKRSRVVLLRKAGKPEGEASSYRPICLLNVVGKVLETMLVARLEEHIKSRGGLSPNQHGFKKSTSTDDAVRKLRQKILAAINFPSDKFCVAISLDIRNAFNTIGWTEVMSALNALDVPAYILRIFQDYFRGRTAETQAGNDWVEVRVTCVVPQGSVVGPLLWNIAYDRVLRLQLPADVELLGFADDTMVIASGRSVAELEMKANEKLGLVSEEISKLGLSLAVNKTEAVLFTNKYKYANPNIILNGQTVEIKQQMKYLGMVIDRRLLFKEHICEASKKAEKTANQLGRLMPNIGGPKQLRRKLYVAVKQSVLLYGAPSWAGTLEYVAGNVEQINRVQRKALLRSICAYRTVSRTATNILSGVPPADLLAIERRAMFDERRSGRTEDMPPRAKTIVAWRKRIEESQTGSWTKLLIPNIESWCSRRHGCLDFHVTQLLSGHGCFGQYLHKIGKEESSKCHHCQDENDTAEHTLFECPAWDEDRREMASVSDLGVELNPGNIVPFMLSGPQRWEAFATYARRVLSAKEIAEREREKPGGPRGRRLR